MRVFRLVLLFAAFSVPPPALATEAPRPQTQPAPEPKTSEPKISEPKTRASVFNDLFAQLREAPDAGRAAEVKALIERVWAHSGSATADLLMARAEAALKSRHAPEAALLLDRIVTLYPDWPQAWRRRAQAALAQGDDEGAMLDLDHALQAEPRDYLAMLQLAELMRARHRDAPALELMRRALASDPSNQTLREDIERLRIEVEGRDI